MYNPRLVVGAFFEQKVGDLFSMIRIDSSLSGNAPDLAAEDGSFYVEVKASAFDNGGVIKERQLLRFDSQISARRFYAFAYHNIPNKRGMRRNYSECELLAALKLRSLYLFPFSIVTAFFEKSSKRKYRIMDNFVTLNESTANTIFAKDRGIWKKLGLDANEYKTAERFKKIHIVTRNGNLEEHILNSIRPEVLD